MSNEYLDIDYRHGTLENKYYIYNFWQDGYRNDYIRTAAIYNQKLLFKLLEEKGKPKQ